VLFGAVGGGADMATDIEDGFFDRLLASPVSRSAILLGRLAGAAALAAFQCAVFVGVLVASGARIKGGPAGLIAIFVCGILLAVGSGGMALALALRTGSAEAVQASFPIFFVFQFLSSAFFPRTLMSGWFKSVATLNPLTWLIESLRNLVISGLTLLDVARPLLVALALCVLSISLSNLALRRRLVRAG
jgi:ABC-2 type transport system permease protein